MNILHPKKKGIPFEEITVRVKDWQNETRFFSSNINQSGVYEQWSEERREPREHVRFIDEESNNST